MTTRTKKTRNGRPVFICVPDYTPGPRAACLNALHDYPLPSGYIASAEVAAARLAKRWRNPRCPDCGMYGWRRGLPLGQPYEPVSGEDQ
jgi:hypothetical protein